MMAHKNKSKGERLEEFVFHEITLEHLHRYAMAIEICKGKTVLDIACGSGYGSNILSQYAAKVVGVDKDAATILKASNKYIRSNLKFITGDLESIPNNNVKFDVVVSFETLEHIENHDQMLKEIKRVLSPGGIILISTPDKLNYSIRPRHENPFHLRELYKAEFEILIKKYFSHYDFLCQKSGLFSVVNPSYDTNKIDYYTGNFDRIEKRENTNCIYLIAIASDSQVPLFNSSVFYLDLLLQKIRSEQIEMIKHTPSYKLGSFILKPFKLIRKLTYRSKNA